MFAEHDIMFFAAGPNKKQRRPGLRSGYVNIEKNIFAQYADDFLATQFYPAQLGKLVSELALIFGNSHDINIIDPGPLTPDAAGDFYLITIRKEFSLQLR